MKLFRLVAATIVLLGSGCTPPPRRHLVDIKGLMFAPAELVAAAGDTIGWVNEDMFPHTSAATGAAGWDTRPIPSGDTAFVVVRRPGTFNYLCEIHPTMRGTITVR